MKQKSKNRLVFVISLFVVLGGLAFLLSPAPEQTENMRQTQHEIDLLKKELASDSRFSNLMVIPTTSNYGMEMLIVGSIPDEMSFIQLKKMVERRVPEKYSIEFYIKLTDSAGDPNQVDSNE